MQALSPAGQQAIGEIAKRHGYSTDAVLSMLQSVINGNGSMAQFNHPEFSGPGQWMRGGMTMVSDMFNNHLKSSVDSLCSELAQLVVAQPGLLQGGSFQSQGQGGQQQQSSHAGGGYGTWNEAAGNGASLFVPPAGGGADWWGPGLRWPDSTGAQNGVRYAYFSQARRLAIEVHGKVTIYDTLDHLIGGFSQQQSGGGSLAFSSQHGLVDVARLPVVSVDGAAPAAPSGQAVPAGAATPPQAGSGNAAAPDIFAMIDRLAELRSRNVLTDAEFDAKKAELLARL